MVRYAYPIPADAISAVFLLPGVQIAGNAPTPADGTIHLWKRKGRVNISRSLKMREARIS